MWQLKLIQQKWKGNLSKEKRGVSKFSSLLGMSLLKSCMILAACVRLWIIYLDFLRIGEDLYLTLF